MNKLELLRELRHRLAIMDDEAPYCIVSRTLLTAVIGNLTTRVQSDETGDLMATIRQHTTKREYTILDCLNQSPGSFVEYGAILTYTDIDTEASLWTHICRLRKKMAGHGWGEIAARRRYGYIWVRPRSEVQDV